MGPVQNLGVERAVDSGPPQRLADDPVVGEVEDPAHDQEDRLDLASECPHA